MFAKAAVYHALGKNSMTTETKIGQPKKQPKKRKKTAEKNTSNGILAKNKMTKRLTLLFR